jgi:hypothetical protein
MVFSSQTELLLLYNFSYPHVVTNVFKLENIKITFAFVSVHLFNLIAEFELCNRSRFLVGKTPVVGVKTKNLQS